MTDLPQTSGKRLHIAVLGAGVVGTTTALYLAERGHAVTVIDKAEGPALETSFANGGQIAATSSAPWAGPDVPGQVLRWLGRPDGPLKWRPRLDMRQWKWLFAFLRRCTAAAHKQGIRRNAALGKLSLEELKAVRDRHAFDYALEERGILKIAKTAKDLHDAEAKIPLLNDMGITVRRVTPEEILEIEPALSEAVAAGEVAGGIHYVEDESGDAHLFSEQAADAAKAKGVQFRFGVDVRGIETDGGRITAIVTSEGRSECDAAVLCLGVGSVHLAEPLGLDLPVYPVKGYSVTVPVDGANAAPHVSITDEERRIVVSRFGDRLRAAGMAEVAGHDLTIDPRRGEAVLAALRALFPAGGDMSKAEIWTGLRPMTPDGAPILGPAPGWPNLFLNTGHGTYGWTMACGSARLIADMVDGAAPPIDPKPYALSRFAQGSRG